MLLTLFLTLNRLEAAKKAPEKMDQKQGMFERSEFALFPIFSGAFLGTPKGQPAAVAFLCLLSLAKQRK